MSQRVRFATTLFIVAFFAFLPISVVIAASELAPEDLAVKVKALFQTSCYGCHGKSGRVPTAGLNILKSKYLIESGLVIPGSSEFSTLFEYLSSGDMPPKGKKFPDGTAPPRPTEVDIDLVRRWIDTGAPSWDGTASAAKLISYATVITAIAKDLGNFDALTAGQTRYLSLANLKNQNLSESEIKTARLGVIKLINSLSVSPILFVPKTIDPDNLILRIDLKALKWLPKSWDRLEKVYPLGVSNASAEEAQIIKKTGARFPFLRADWFIEFASRPPLYHDLLFTDAIGSYSERDALQELESALKVNRVGNILAGNVLRAGFSSSGVSVNNRIIERHDIKSYQGGYWISYDFEGNSADQVLRQNIFSFPLGPANAFPGAVNTFNHAGGEVIFSLPNGLQGYLLTNAKGGRLEKAPTQIVTDPARPDHAVENGVSCFRCHNQGVVLKQDSIRAFVERNRVLFKEDLNLLDALYKDRSLFQEGQRKDLNRFLTAITGLGIDIRDPEPVSTSVLNFEADMTLSVVASEFYLHPDALKTIVGASPTLGRLIGPLLVAGGTVKRGFVIENFATLFEQILVSSTTGGRSSPLLPMRPLEFLPLFNNEVNIKGKKL